VERIGAGSLRQRSGTFPSTHEAELVDYIFLDPPETPIILWYVAAGHSIFVNGGLRLAAGETFPRGLIDP
jgi:hypothetical protein